MDKPKFTVPYERLPECMTLRDYFAARAMQALITRETKMIPDPSVYAGAAYDLADAMLEARKNEIRHP